MSKLCSFFQRFIPLLERYLHSTDKSEFVASLADSTERAVLSLLISPCANIEQLREEMNKLNFPSDFQKQLINSKLLQFLSQQPKLNEQMLVALKKQYCDDNDFDYAKPANITSANQDDQVDRKPSKLTLPDTLSEFFNSKLKTSPESAKDVTYYGLVHLSDEDIQALPLEQQERILESNMLLHIPDTILTNFIRNFLLKKKLKKETFTLSENVYNNLTIDQLLALKKSIPELLTNQQYLNAWFNRNLCRPIANTGDFEDLSHEERVDKLQALCTIKKELQHLNTLFTREFSNKIHLQIMFFELHLERTNLDNLVTLLKTRSDLHFPFTQRHQVYLQEKVNEWRKETVRPIYECAFETNKTDISAIFNDYLWEVIRCAPNSEEIVTKLNGYIQMTYLKKIETKIKLARGETVEKVLEFFTNEELLEMKDKKKITIKQSNKTKYRASDAVALKILVKNVPQLTVSIYELNLEKHYVNFNFDPSDSVDLSHIAPSACHIYATDILNPYHEKEVEIPLDLEKKQAVYIIDFQGEGVTSRAVIRKGGIICLEEVTVAGTKFNFHDETGKRLTKEDGLRLWVNGHNTTLGDNNSLTIGYKDENQDAKIVAALGSYATKFFRTIPGEEPALSVKALFTSQSFLVGKKAQLALHPQLTFKGQNLDFGLLTDSKVKATLVSEHEIHTNYNFDVTFSSTKDVLVEFPIQSYTKKIILNVTSKALLMSGTKRTLSWDKEIQINLCNNSSSFHDFYLAKKKQDYVLTVLGLNGERIPCIEVKMLYEVLGFGQVETALLETDEHGQINLGKLKIVKRIQTVLNTSGGDISRVWLIQEDQMETDYSDCLIFKLGQSINLPCPAWKAGDVLLVSKDKAGRAVANLTTHISLHHDRLQIKDLPAGQYELQLLPIGKDISIDVVQGEQWEKDENKVFDAKQSVLHLINRNVFKSISISKVEYQGDKATILLNLHEARKQGDNVIIHVYPTNYLVPEAECFKKQLESGQEEKRVDIWFKKSAYFNDKQLSEESAYVLNRQKAHPMIGNNLEKPRIFLKRFLVRETEAKDETLNQGGLYENEGMMNRTKMNAQKLCRKGGPPPSIDTANAPGLSNHNNFLLHSGHLSDNLKGDKLTVAVPKGYHNLVVYVVTSSSEVRKTFPLSVDTERELKNITHLGIKDTGGKTGWTMSREVYSLHVGEQHTVSRDCEWRPVSAYDVLAYMQNKGIELDSVYKDILRWKTFTEEKKQEVYNEGVCHQLNVYLRFKDPDFFQRVVKPFIGNKIKKTVVDLCLLGDQRALEYTAMEKLKKMNDFEKCLLIQELVRHGQMEKAKAIANAMLLTQKSKKTPFKQYKKSFDTVINAMVPSEEGEGEGCCGDDDDERGGGGGGGGYKQESMRYSGGGGGGGQRLKCARSVPSEDMIMRKKRMQKPKAFTPIQRTKEYTQRTYIDCKDYDSEAVNLITPSSFWSQLANHLASASSKAFLTQQFMQLSNSYDLFLALAYLPCAQCSYDIGNCEGGYLLTAKSDMLLFVKQFKQRPSEGQLNIMISQRFFDPNDKYSYEQDGTTIQRQVTEFVVNHVYELQTVVSNTSGTSLELQILIDIPQGSIPLNTLDYTEIRSQTIKSYSTKQFSRQFYFPHPGIYNCYASNVCRGNTIIGRGAAIPALSVTVNPVVSKFQSFSEILRSGSQEEVFTYLQDKNIFDQKIFDQSLILWKLRDANFFRKVIEIFTARQYYSSSVWSFGFYHGNLPTMLEYIRVEMNQNLNRLNLPLFEYFPYYSNRTHKFANENRSTIRNVQFKETYINFLVKAIMQNRSQCLQFKIASAYYYLLQDRLADAQNIINSLSEQERKQHQLQLDYMICFIDMSFGHPTCEKARKIAKSYENYPVTAWRKLFQEVSNTLREDEEADLQEEKPTAEHRTTVINDGPQLRITVAENSKIQVQFHKINLELYYSQEPFKEISELEFIRPTCVKTFERSNISRQERVERSELCKDGDYIVSVHQYREGVPPNKIMSFLWTNQNIKVKLNQTEGTVCDYSGRLQVFLNKKRQSGCYCKVYKKEKDFAVKFYRDGYTDITGAFKYAMDDLDGITDFAILVVTDQGGVITKVKPPSKQNFIAQ